VEDTIGGDHPEEGEDYAKSEETTTEKEATGVRL